MKRIIQLVFCLFTAFLAFGNQEPPIAIIPQPVSLIRNSGTFKLPANLVISINKGSESVAEFFKEAIAAPTGIPVKVVTFPAKGSIQFQINRVRDQVIGM
jgi:hexosaminidase